MNIADMVGRVFSSVVRSGDEITFTEADGSYFRFYHSGDCCESVTIEGICGDLADLTGVPLIQAEESTSRTNPPGVVKEWQDSFTWTFYKFATVKGYVTIRWYGESNGYYSESVDLEYVDAHGQSQHRWN